MKQIGCDTAVSAILFDWDGTLLNSYRADASAYERMFHALGIQWGREDLEKHYSPNWHRVYRAAGIPQKQWAEADGLWRNAYRKQHPALMPGARQVLRRLSKQYLLALVTSGNGERVRKQLRRFGLSCLFSVHVFAEDTDRRKPHPAPLKLALQRLRLRPQGCVYVGDSPEDIEMARYTGVRAIGVYGPFPNHTRLRAAKADALLNSLRDLPELLRSLSRSELSGQ